jgi:AraC-like DNA-binding protein
VLIAHGGLAVGTATMRSTFLFEPGLHVHAVERTGLVYDSRLAPEASGDREVIVVYVAASGVLEIGSAAGDGFEAADAVVLRESSLEGPRAGRTVALRSHGAPFVGIDLRFARARVIAAPLPEGTRLRVDATVREAIRAIAGRDDEREVEARVGVVLAWLEREGIVGPRPVSSIPKAVERLWSAVRPLVEKLAVLPSLDELSMSTGLSLRQLARNVDTMFDSVGIGDGWRPLTLRMRLKLAVLALSCADATVAEVAKKVGYSSPDAMGRAFRDAGLPAPSEVRRIAGGGAT